jgi:hypothetical protein
MNEVTAYPPRRGEITEDTGIPLPQIVKCFYYFGLIESTFSDLFDSHVPSYFNRVMLTPVRVVNDTGNDASLEMDNAPVMYDAESALFDNDAIRVLTTPPRVDR